ncbi:unnamed protein product [Paramecium pentaurelia]|uniref:Uncharacterized protein n=1 Tax=Paramecium pentaurelia TaxID=43138 RepID=A0A8S1U8V7_9CILI|nr:unnamed protein product [Paramecium pentaurelia]
MARQYQEDACLFYNIENLNNSMFSYIQQNHLSNDLYDSAQQEIENHEAGNNPLNSSNFQFSSTDDQKQDESYIKIQKQNYQYKICGSQF